MKFKDLRETLSIHFDLLIHDRRSDVGTVYESKVMHVSGRWDDRDVAYIRRGPNHGLIVELI